MNVANSESSQIRTFAVLYQSEMDNFFKEEKDFISTDGTVETELKVTHSALDVHRGCTPFVKDW